MIICFSFIFNKVHTHCYEAVDLDDFVRVRNVQVEVWRLR
jgi:hypothetical protein